MVPPLYALSLALCHEALEGGGYQQMETSIAKRNFPSCSLRSQFTASQKLPLLFPNAKHMEPATGTIKSQKGGAHSLCSLARTDGEVLTRFARSHVQLGNIRNGVYALTLSSLRNIYAAHIYFCDTFRYATLRCKHHHARTYSWGI